MVKDWEPASEIGMLGITTLSNCFRNFIGELVSSCAFCH